MPSSCVRPLYALKAYTRNVKIVSIDPQPPRTTYPAIVGRIMGEARKHVGLEQAQVAQNLGLSQSTYSRIERGDQAPTLEQIAQTAEILNTTPGQILGDADRAAAGLRSQGIEVMNRRPKSPQEKAVAFIALGALALLIARILSAK